jgi:A/G-specific adenine glycosylase
MRQSNDPTTRTARGSATVDTLHRALLGWYDEHKRDLPWRRTRDPWAIWVSEIMLQQTRVDTVMPYYERFLTRFPTPLALAEAAEDEVLAQWSGLGYYRRARLLHAGARAVVDRASLPSTWEELLQVPGIGRYTAGAVASIAYGETVGLVDGNVARVFARLFGIDEDMRGVGMKKAETLADEIVSKERPGDWNQALMELGATVCTPRAPACDRCPLSSECVALRTKRVDELPKLSAKAPPKSKRLHVLVMTLPDSKIVLGRRSGSGLFGGLWEPLSVEGSRVAMTKLTRALGVEKVTLAGKVKHILSHQRLEVSVYAARVSRAPEATGLPTSYERVSAFSRKKLEELGISTLTRKVLAAAGH